ncbi:unnamed protein product [Microthlaspi erraticum]|uniref:Reverse transcriptase domain-containing protein n=1 Tax=Microthlaspi erraticum TaxID=1685480 RepID=A0A6D2ING1_9BRAS|nr:unnamed protein product [Microthlaspi erraticum]
MITCEVLLPDTQSWIVISVVYASNDVDTRQELWQELRNMHSHQRVQGKAWLILGDFNQTLNPSEHSTVADPIAKKLDRALVIDLWNIQFPSSFAIFGEPDFSDHASCGIVLDASSQRHNRPFKFFNFLLKNNEFLDIVERHCGSKIEGQEEILSHCVDYFQELLGAETDPQMFTQGDLNLLLPFNCSPEQSASLEKEFSAQEIRDAFVSLPRNKMCGPDGFSDEFFTSFWNVVGPEVTEAVGEFFRSGSILKQWNATTLVLIPKITNASKTSDFRPISCLNTVYMVISKLLANRLQKAFDSVRWDFILSALQAINVPKRFINWIEQCISTASFSVSVNGITGGYFRSTTGLRQGDPLSPYLFVLAMEIFSSLLKSRFDAGYIRYHPNTEDLSISHLMFADDVMIFFDGGCSSLHGINEALNDFASLSGLEMNKDKTSLYHAGLSQSETSAITTYRFKVGSLPIRYLGLPLIHRKLRIPECAPLIDTVKSKFRSWSVKTLSFAGRVQLIKSVISGIVAFWISTFILPKGCIKQIESLCCRFLWSGSIETAKGVKVSWEVCCLPKKEGGLGLRRFSSWNRTLFLRLIWLLFSNTSSLWVAWHRQHHLRDQSFWSIKENVRDSWNWRSLLHLRASAQNFIHVMVGNGASTSFWYDSWTPFGALINYVGIAGPRSFRIPWNAKVSEACND